MSKFPVNKGILDAAWLLRVAADDPDDLTLIADLHRTWRSAPPDNAGEAELVALSRRYGWIALLEDGQGREGAAREGVYPVRLTTCAAAAAACGVMTADRAWGLHHVYHARRSWPPSIGTKPADRLRFEHAIEIVTRLKAKLDAPPWPQILRHPDLQPGAVDDVVRQSARA